MKAFHTSNRGQAVLLVSLSFPLTAAMLGLVVDVGWSYYRTQAALGAANTAAMAGAIQVYNAGGSITCNSGVAWCNTTPQSCASSPNSPPHNSYDTACLYAKQNGFTASGNQKVTVEASNSTAPTAPGHSSSYYMTVRVSEKIPFTFLSLWGAGNSHSVTARSSSGVFPPWSGGCVYALDPANVDISLNGNATLTTGCGIYADSSSNSAITLVGNNAQITASGASRVHVVGNVSTHSPSQISPAPNLGSPTVADPFQDLAVPPTSSCINYSGQATISAATYCNVVSLNNGSLTMNPGVYVLQNGISVGGNATVTNNTTGGEMAAEGS